MLLCVWRSNVNVQPPQYAILATSLASILLQSLTLHILIKRNLVSEFPIFFRYSAYCVCAGVLTVATSFFAFPWWHRPYVDWFCTGLMFCFQFGVMYESFVNVLKPYSALIDLGKMIFRWVSLFMFVAMLFTGFLTQGAGGDRILNAANAANVVERTLALLQIGLLLLFFVFERKLGLAWRSYSLAIAMGLGISAATTLCTSYLSAEYPTWQPAIILVTKVVYLAIIAFWTLILRQGEPARKNVLDSPSRLIFQRWNEALLSYGYGNPATPSGVESVLPGIEKMVDRVIARTIQ